jgi:hypothetical protein
MEGGMMKDELEELKEAWDDGSEHFRAIFANAEKLDLPCEFCAVCSFCVVAGCCLKEANEKKENSPE